MAFDIAGIQDLYGANMSSHANADSYVLPDANAAGTYYSCIWDAGGTDAIGYNGTRDAVIDLRAATLD
jgi:serralysin